MFSTASTTPGFLIASNMSDESDTSPDPSTPPVAADAPRTRRVSTPRPKKKVAKSAPAAPQEETPAAAELAPEAKPAAAPAAEVTPAPAAAPTPEPTPPIAVEEAPGEVGGAWPEPEVATTGSDAFPSESSKRKRRRRKGKGQSGGSQNPAVTGNEDTAPVAAEFKPSEGLQEPRQRPNSNPNQNQNPNPQPQPQHAPQRPKIDPEKLTKMAWKIYLAEVSEEGVALIGDNDAKDLSRRCFRLAEIFIEEQSRRR
jgi:hypothetical protein